MLNLCIAGASGRMGTAVIREAIQKGYRIVGAIASPRGELLGKSLQEAGIGNSSTQIVSPEKLRDAIDEADVYITFTNPEAELANLPLVAAMNKPLIIGTTGFTEEQWDSIKDSLTKRVRAVFAPNFSVGVNVLFKLTTILQAIPSNYDISITEIHHTNKKDSPSGTAKRLCNLISKYKGYSKFVYGREGFSEREPAELEVLSIRVGGVPGIHDIIIGGPDEMLRIEHTAFSRKAFAKGTLYAAEWLHNQTIPGIYTMEDVLFSEAG